MKVGADRTELLAEIDKLRGEITALHNDRVVGPNAEVSGPAKRSFDRSA